MKTILLALALLAYCSAYVPSEFRNLTTIEIEYNSHVQSLIPSALDDVLTINDLENKFNTTDFIVDKINFVSQKEFAGGYIYKINVDFLNSADEIANTQFIGTFNSKMNKLSIPSLNYDIKYPKVQEEQEIFVPSPINGTYSTGIFKTLRDYLNENFNNTATNNSTYGNATMYNSTYPPEYFNNTQQWGNYSTYSYNISNNTSNYTMNNRTNMTDSEISSANITDFVYKTLNMLVDNFNSTMSLDNNSFNKTSNGNFTGFDELEFEPVLDAFLQFAKKGIEETFGMSMKELLHNLGENFEVLHDIADDLHDVADEMGDIFA